MGKWVAAGCLGLAALSLLVPSAPTTDPWGWIVWGREVAGLELDTAVGGAPAWKPLPVLFTTVFSLAGDAAPQLWLVLARAGGLVALVLAFLLGRRLAGPVAGAAGALALLLSYDWVRGLLHGYSEPLVVALLLGALELHLRDRPRIALLAACLAGLARPECWLFAAAYGIWLWRRRPEQRGLVAGSLLAVPALWLGGDLWGSGNPLNGGASAASLTDEGGRTPFEQLGVALEGGLWALLPFALAAVALNRLQRRLVLWLAGGAVAWIALVLVLDALGSPASPRFFTFPLAALYVLAGAGLVELARLARARPLLRPALAAGMVAACLLLASGRGASLPASVEAAQVRADAQRELRHAAARLRARVARRSVLVLTARKDSWNHGALAWELGIPIARVGSLETCEEAGPDDLVLLESGGAWRVHRLGGQTQARAGKRARAAKPALPAATSVSAGHGRRRQ